jgi:hypothetical protein
MSEFEPDSILNLIALLWARLSTKSPTKLVYLLEIFVTVLLMDAHRTSPTGSSPS